MNIGEYSVRNPVVSWLLVIILVGGGIWGFQGMGKLEDPAFTVKLAKVVTFYPGASAQQVQDEVTYHIEEALQLMEQVKGIKRSVSRPGFSDITVEFQDKYRAADFPNIYDELRRKIADMQYKLPPGAQAPVVIDSFADVYGIYLSLSGEGYSWRDLWDTADFLKKQLVLVPGVRKIVIDGKQSEVAYLEISRARLGELGIPLDRIAQVLKSQNVVADAGNVQVGDEYLRIWPTGESSSVQSIADVLVSSDSKKLVRLGDIAEIQRAYEAVSAKYYYADGHPALMLGISAQAGANVVEVGSQVDRRLAELQTEIPIGMELQAVYDQPKEVETSVTSFIVSVAQAVVIVLVVLLLFMGVRVGFIIGAALLITVAGTLFIMAIYGIELQRISLGALVIALGMLVDNAIVVAEGMLVRMNAGMQAPAAARETVGKTMWALLGGTLIGILAFSGIGFSQDSTGEFAGSMFYVILIALSLSWITAISTTPLLCALLLKPGGGGDQEDAYGALPFRVYRGLLAGVLRWRWLTLGAVIGLFVLSLWGFGFVKQAFFPPSNTPLFFVDLWEPEGTDIRKTREDALRVSEFLRGLEGVEQTATVIGGPHQRFTLVYDSKDASSAYAQIIVRTDSRERIDAVWNQVNTFLRDELYWTDPIIKSLMIGPGRDSKIEARFHGPDPTVLRELAAQAKAIMRAEPGTKEVRDDWREPVKVIRPVFNEQVGRQLGISREDLAGALQYAFDGVQVGVYRDGERLLPILMRAPEKERLDVTLIQDIQVWSPMLQRSVPVSQVVDRFETKWENQVIGGRDRTQTIIASCNPTGELAGPLFEALRPQIDAIELPPGYSLSWGGEFEDQSRAQASLFGALPPSFLAMVLVSILLFGKLRQPLIIWLTVPLAIVGITAGLLGTNAAFDFMSMLGALSLVGLLIKNAIVLIEEIDQQIETGKPPETAILDSGVSRMRPVVLAAATTILGLIPLLPDVFFVNMAITMMAGLGFATVLTLLVVPTLYAMLFRIPSPKVAGAAGSHSESVAERPDPGSHVG
ncbi:efflux RND transporter permease subunit [Thiorhodovibrio frisius]|uniref:Cation/multidrug efflux pump n=1 Tax=Thiorhodovibrio frisius TaxID=631362 RepID=H8YW68_9GAMM|nr:efflux RND transporter permease subunit [Thiorhodovibrio frisius]EIC23859.1 cation/multidrug efflux pump [Thiorhodovibrio frisius]WPL23231.1 Swarming motility protein SwrC [Thiorhodovibrio frisius]